MDWVRLLFSFKGRINRARYIAVQLALLILWLVWWLEFPSHLALQGNGLNWAVTLAMIWINVATTAKRFHDHDRRGWWAIAVLVLNRLSYVYYGLFLGNYFGVDVSIGEELLLVIIVVALSLLQTWVVVELFFLAGTDGPNRFGPDPLRTVPASAGVLQTEPARVPDFLVGRAGPLPRR